MVIENPVAAVNAAGGANGNNAAHPSGIPQDKIDNIMSGIANTGDVKMNNHRKKLRQRFDIIKKLGQGTYGKVQLGINKETGQEVAIKTIKKCKIEAEADLVRIRREVQIMSSVQHPNIIHIYEVFENREKMVLVMEFAAGGELYDYLSERKVLSEEEARRIFRQVATAVYYCHKHKICHRDLKLENILLDEHGNAKIADFGLSNVFDDHHLLGTFCGSPLYASPEIVEGTPYWGPEVDCWSLGVLLYTLVYGSMPFDGSNFKRLVKQISQGDYYEPKKPSRASTLIREMLTVSPQKRATIEQICAHWWVNENDNVSCLELAENLANQTPVRLDVLLSLTPAAVVAEQLVVPSADGGGNAGKVGNSAMPRSHSVGSIRDMSAANATTEAEQRILDMVAAGGEAALMPSPTRTITPAASPVQTKRKLETTVSMENAAAALKKKEKAGSSSVVIDESTLPLTEEEPMETEDAIVEEPPTPAAVQHTSSLNFSQKDMELIDDMCVQLMENKENDEETAPSPPENAIEAAPPIAPSPVINAPRQKTVVGKLDAVAESPEEKEAAKVIKKFVNKQKAGDLVNAIGAEKVNETPPPPTPTKKTTASKSPTKAPQQTLNVAPFVRKCSLQDESALNKFNTERRKSRILETAEKFQQMNNAANASECTSNAAAAAAEKPKKIVIPGISVGSFKKEFERKASKAGVPQQGPTPGERRALEQAAAAAAEAAEREVSPPPVAEEQQQQSPSTTAPETSEEIENSDSKNSVQSLTLDDARRSMENSIALLRQAQSETTTKDVDQLCAKTESIGVSEPRINLAAAERERKLQNARAVIGSAIQPVIRRPQAQPEFPQPQPAQAQAPLPPQPLFPPSTTFYGIAGGGGDGGGNRNFANTQFGGMGKSSGSGGLSSGLGAGFGFGFGGVGQKNPVGNIIGGKSKVISNSDNAEGSGANNVQSNNYNNYNNFNNFNNNQMPIAEATNFHAKSKSFANSNSFPNEPPSPSPAQILKARQNIMRHFVTGAPGWGLVPLHRQQIQQSGLPNTRQKQGASVSAKAKLFGQQFPQQQQQQLQQQQQQQYHQQQHHHQQKPNTFPASFPNASAPFLVAGTATSTAGDNKATTNNVVNLNSVPKPFYNARTATPTAPTTSNWLLKSSPDPNNGTVKTSTASITLKSATLPRRKTAKTEIQLDIKPRIMEQQPEMRFTTEMQHPVADLRSAPPREGPVPYSPVKTTPNARATSLEPKEHIIHIQRPPQIAYSRTTSNSTNRSDSLSRQSTNDSESESTTNLSQSTMTASSQPIKKSPREFIIPIAVEGGGFITPREGSIEPSESSHTTSSRTTFNRFNQRPARRIGSLLSDAGTDESPSGLHFQKLRTGPISRDGDDDDHFTLHRLRSSRPVKKLSQDNDSNSSGEEDDDDDGFEILTAENLFSTLLQRVRALTNRLNVNNDLTSGFPNSSRLLTSMRHDRAPFWNEEPFSRSQMSYTYSETVEKKHVRLKNSSKGSNVSGSGSGSGIGSGIGSGAPWRHSMSRDLGSDMDSMFSRTGATLPRGSGSKMSKKPTKLGSVEKQAPLAKSEDNVDDRQSKGNQGATDEPLDLADLDLSRLRLSKKELETLSSIAPGLPKCFQEQLLAKLPPMQARKLSRTLSMQNEPHTSKVKIYKRSQSGGRKTLGEAATNVAERCSALPEECESSPAKATTGENTPEQSSQLPYRNSLNRTRFDGDSAIPTPLALDTSSGSNSLSNRARKSRSNSVCRDDYSKSLCSSYTSDISDKYKYYSPYLSKSTREPTTTTTTTSSTESGSVSPYKRYSSVSPRESTIGAVVGRPPSGCLSPSLPTAATAVDVGNSNSLRRRTAQRRISRFLRPDFYEEQPIPTIDDTPYQREKKQREHEAQSVLREIREKTRDCSRERTNSSNLNDGSTANVIRKHSVIGAPAELLDDKRSNRHVRNKSLELFDDPSTAPSNLRSDSPTKRHRRSLSRSRKSIEELDTHALADKILQELQLLSEIRSEQDKQEDPAIREVSLERTTENKTLDKDETADEKKTILVKKVKKIKPKEKTTDVGSEPTDSKLTTTTTVVKKVKKIAKKADSAKIPTTELAADNESLAIEQSSNTDAQKVSKLKRPKSYPTKELALRSEMPNKPLPQVIAIPEAQCDIPTCPQLQQCTAETLETSIRESRLMRPKSYPTSKLTAPKEIKKTVIRNGTAISPIDEYNKPVPEDVSKSASNSRPTTLEDKSQSVTPTGKSSRDTSSSESRPTIKKIIKVNKKSKLIQPTTITPTTPTSTSVSAIPINTPSTAAPTPSADPSKDWKEKSPEKKPGKGLLYAIGQKFEKFRDSALNKEKKALTNSGSSTAPASTNATSAEFNAAEKTEKKTSLLKKKKSQELSAATTPTAKTEKPAKTIQNEEYKTTKPNGSTPVGKPEKRSRFDAMIRSLRERSVPRAQPAISESNYIKRAISVEDMPRTNNRTTVNRVLGLFKRSEKEGSTDRRVRSTRSASNIERQLCETSPIYQNTKEARAAAEAEEFHHGDCDCDVVIAPETLTCPECIAQHQTNDGVVRRREPREGIVIRSEDPTTPMAVTKTMDSIPHQGNKDKRKGLMLDLVKVENANAYIPYSSSTSTGTTTTRNSKVSYINGNNGSSSMGNGVLYSNLPPYPCAIPNSSSNPSSSQHSIENNTNNNSCMTNNNNNNNSSSMQTSQTSGYRTSSTHEINRNNLLSPSSENIANYSSDCSRSYQDDCASTSTFLSPTDEPELYFDNWSVCSEDNYMLHATPSPTVSRLSRVSQLSSPTRVGSSGCGGGGDSSDPNESVIDRIKRRSFYSRFNEKKPKRTSSIVGPTAVRDYYREQKAAIKAARSAAGCKPSAGNGGGSERKKSPEKPPDITQQFLRPLKLSPAGTELKPPVYKSPYSDYTSAHATLTKPRKSLNDIRTVATPSYLASKHRYGTSSNNEHKTDYLTVPTAASSASRYKSSSSPSPYKDGSISIVGSGAGTTTCPGSSYYSTYNPKRRSSYTLNGLLPTGSATSKVSPNIDGYATLGRRTIRPYDQRTVSVLDPTTSTSSTYRRDTRTPIRDYTTPLVRSDSRYRATSTSRSPTNI